MLVLHWKLIQNHTDWNNWGNVRCLSRSNFPNESHLCPSWWLQTEVRLSYLIDLKTILDCLRRVWLRQYGLSCKSRRHAFRSLLLVSFDGKNQWLTLNWGKATDIKRCSKSRRNKASRYWLFEENYWTRRSSV